MVPGAATTHSGWNPYAHRHGDTAGHHRRADPARHRLRDRLPAKTERLGRRRLLRRRRDQPGRRERGDGLRRDLRRPVVFFCQNNQWAISEPVGCRRSSRSPIGRRGSASRACASTATTCSRSWRRRAWHSTARARGDGPTFIEAVTYRMGPHTTSDDPTPLPRPGRRSSGRPKDPIARLERSCAQTACSTTSARPRSRRRRIVVAAELRAGCLALPDPEPIGVFDHVYAEPHSGARRAARRVRRVPRRLSTVEETQDE